MNAHGHQSGRNMTETFKSIFVGLQTWKWIQFVALRIKHDLGEGLQTQSISRTKHI